MFLTAQRSFCLAPALPCPSPAVVPSEKFLHSSIFLINRMEDAFSALLTSTPPPPVKGLLLDKFYIVSFPFSWNRRDQHLTRGPASQKPVLSGSTEWSAGKHNGAAEHSTTHFKVPGPLKAWFNSSANTKNHCQTGCSRTQANHHVFQKDNFTFSLKPPIGHTCNIARIFCISSLHLFALRKNQNSHDSPWNVVQSPFKT